MGESAFIDRAIPGGTLYQTVIVSAQKNERSVMFAAPAHGMGALSASGGKGHMSTQKIYALPVETTGWKFDGATEISFNWEYDDGSADLLNLYEKGKQQQWDTSTRIDWTQELFESNPMGMADETIPIYGSPFWEKMTEKEKEWLRFNLQCHSICQFMHGEQGALICTAKIVETVPWYDAKLYASTQVVDEARHVEVFARYLDEKLGGSYQINAHLRMLLDDIVNDSRWDMTYLGMQIMVEGLALAAFGNMQQMTTEPLLKKLLRYVMSDEARHVAFGVLSLQEVYKDMSDAEIKERQEFAYEASVRMRDRFMSQEVWERMGVNPRDVVPLILRDPTREVFQQMLFAKIVPNCKKLGLLDRNDSWLRRRYEEMGVIQFENAEDTGEEYVKYELGETLADVQH